MAGPSSSTYWWENKIETAQEWLYIIKSKRNLYEELEQAIREMHPYKVPDILATPVVAGSKKYLEWLGKELKRS